MYTAKEVKANIAKLVVAYDKAKAKRELTATNCQKATEKALATQDATLVEISGQIERANAILAAVELADGKLSEATTEPKEGKKAKA